MLFCGKFIGVKYFFFTIFIIFQLFDKSEAWFENCDYVVNLKANNSIYINSPNYPNNYPPGSSCRYSITAPLDYDIILQCNISIPKSSQQCSSDYFYVSVDGNKQLNNSEYLCGKGYIQRNSEFNKLVIAYTSSTNKYSGQFSCLVETRPQPCDCGWSLKSRIVGGVETGTNEFPFMAGIYYKPTKEVFCGGAIISHNYIVSAAHCVALRNNPANLLVIVGDHDLRTSSETPYTQSIEVSQIIKNEGYKYGTKEQYNDIALLKVAKPIEWSRGVGPVCLPFLFSYLSFTGMNVTVIGWGATDFGDDPSPVLLKAIVKVIDNFQCLRQMPNVTYSQMCTYTPTKDTCQGDSGGPLVLRGSRMFTIGIVSYGTGCAIAPGVNTRLTSFLDWILNKTGENFCQKNLN